MPIPELENQTRTIESALEKARALRADDQMAAAAVELESLLAKISSEHQPFHYNLVLNELEISQKKVVLRSKPRQMGLTLTHRCNILCTMCFYPTDPWDMPEARIEEIPGFFPYLESLYWQGGEAFVSKHFRRLFQESCRYPHIHQVITTNGLLINEEWAEMIVGSATSVVFSIDGVTAETYEKIRAGGRWDRLIQALDFMNKYRAKFSESGILSRKFETIMQFTVMKGNYRELDRLVEFVRKHRFDALNINPIQNIFGPENIFHTKDAEALDFIMRVEPVIREECERHNIRLHIQLPRVADKGLPPQGPDRINETAPKSLPGVSKDGDLFCYWPWLSLFTLLRGATRPWGWCCKDVTADLAANSFEQVWNNEMMQLYRHKLAFNENVGFCDARCTSGVMPKSKLGRTLG